MKIERLKIENFRVFRDVQIVDIPDLAIFLMTIIQCLGPLPPMKGPVTIRRQGSISYLGHP